MAQGRSIPTVNVLEPMSTVMPGVQGVILSILVRTDQPLTGRTVAALAGDRASSAGVARAMRSLVASGLVHEVPAGRAKLYSLNRQHVAYPAIAELADLRTELYRRIANAVATWSPPPLSTAMFGSMARDTSVRTVNDVDLMLVRPDAVEVDDPEWARQVADLSSSITAWSGKRCDVLEFDLDELRQLKDGDDPLIGSLERDATTLHGRDVRSLLEDLTA